MEKNDIVRIWVTLYTRQSFKSGRRWYPYKTREQILKIIDYLKTNLPVKKIEVVNEHGKIYRNAGKWKVRGIDIELAKSMVLTHKKEYEKVYKTIDNFLLRNGFPIYNMWGYSSNRGPWQMDGRHAHIENAKK